MTDVMLAPCPFCGSADDLSLVGDADEPVQVSVFCGTCFCAGPEAILGCRDEEEEGPFDLDAEATELWNQRHREVTPEDIYAIASQIEKALAELEESDPEVKAAKENYEAVVARILSEKGKK